MTTFSQFAQNMDWAGLVNLLLQILAVLLCLTVHETCHGLAAYALGDPTAKQQHRLSLNPLRHIDPFGALMMLVAGFGWAKPVPVDMRYFKHPKSGMAITALAGPVSNFIMAYVSMVGFAFAYGYYAVHPAAQSSAFLLGLLDFLRLLTTLNVGLGIFNLIPFPPLDGSKVLGSFLPDRTYYTILRYESIGMLVLMAALWFGLLDLPLHAARQWVLDLMVDGSDWAFRLMVHG